jgi:hypothetical protein
MTNADDVQSSLFPEPFVQNMEEAHQARAQLLHAESLLGDWGRVRSWLRDEDADEAEAHRDLKARRVELMERLERLDAGKERLPESSRLAARVARRPFVDWGDFEIRYPFGCAPSEGAVRSRPRSKARRLFPAAAPLARSRRSRRLIRGRLRSPTTEVCCATESWGRRPT